MGFEIGAEVLGETLFSGAAAEGAAAAGAEAIGAEAVGAGMADWTAGMEGWSAGVAADAAPSLAETAFNETGFTPSGLNLSSSLMPGETGGVPVSGTDFNVIAPGGTPGGGTTGGGVNLGAIGQGIGAGLNYLQGQQLTNLAKTADPFAPYRPQFAQQLSALMANPSLVTTMPGYTAGLTAAEQALTRNMAAQGLTGSGTAAQALTNFGAQYQNTAFNNLLSQLTGLSGANIAGAGTALQGTAMGMSTQNQALLNLFKAFPTFGG